MPRDIMTDQLVPHSKLTQGNVQAQGLIFALMGYGLLSVGDAIVKSMTPIWPGTAIAVLRYMMAAIGLGVLLLLREGRDGFRVAHMGLHWARGGAIAFSALCFFIGIRLIPLADATAITFIMPMIAGLLSAIFFREKMSSRAILATCVAFLGVLIILRPNLLAAGPAAMLPLGSAFGMACLMLLNQRVAGSASLLATQFIVAALAVPFLLATALLGHVSGIPSLEIGWPHWSVILRCAIVAVSASVAHALIFMATTRASAATVAPMTYAQLLVAMIISTLVFSHPPDLTSLGGSALIIGAGLYIWRSAQLR
jgi:drug/metabolite transporter (DMT)-like permease